MDISSNPFAPPQTKSCDVAKVAKPRRKESPKEIPVLQYESTHESTLEGLRNAVETGNNQEAQRLMEHALAAYMQAAKNSAKTQDASPEQQLRISKSLRPVSIPKAQGLLQGLQAPRLASEKGAYQGASLEDGLLRSNHIETDGMQIKFPVVKRSVQQSFNQFPKYNTRSRLVNVLQLRGGGEDDEMGTINPINPDYGTLKGDQLNDPRVPVTSVPGDPPIKETSGAIPIINPTLAQKLFIMFDDDVISIALVLGDCGCSFMSMLVKWSSLTMLSDIILWVMVFQQCLEIAMNSSLAKYQRMLADGDKIEIIERLHTSTFHHDRGMDKPRGGAYLLPGSPGSVFVIRPRVSAHEDEGAFIKIDGIENELYFVPWKKYRHLQIVSGLSEYMTNPVNIFNIVLLLSVIIMPYIDAGAKGVAFLILLLRIIKPFLKIYTRKLKLDEAGEKTGLVEEEEEEEEEEEGHGEGENGENVTKRDEPRLCC